MVIYACMVAVQNENKQIWIVNRDYEVSSLGLMMRGSVKDTFKFVVRESFPCLSRNTRTTVAHDDKVCHILSSTKPVAAYAFVDKDYPERIIFAFLYRVLTLFLEATEDKWRNFKSDDNLAIKSITMEFNRFQQPSKVDKLHEALAQVDKTKVVLHESIRKLLENQGDLDKLIANSKDLSAHAKQFYQTSKSMNKSCCTLI